MSRRPLQLSLDDLNRKVGERLIWQEENQQRRTGWLELSRKFVGAALDPVVVNMSSLTKRGSRILVVKALIHSLNAAGPTMSVPAGPAFGQEDPHAACAMPPSYVPAELREPLEPVDHRQQTGELESQMRRAGTIGGRIGRLLPQPRRSAALWSGQSEGIDHGFALG